MKPTQTYVLSNAQVHGGCSQKETVFQTRHSRTNVVTIVCLVLCTERLHSNVVTIYVRNFGDFAGLRCCTLEQGANECIIAKYYFTKHRFNGHSAIVE